MLLSLDAKEDILERAPLASSSPPGKLGALLPPEALKIVEVVAADMGALMEARSRLLARVPAMALAAAAMTLEAPEPTTAAEGDEEENCRNGLRSPLP
jgi:hypothetical protein